MDIIKSILVSVILISLFSCSPIIKNIKQFDAISVEVGSSDKQNQIKDTIEITNYVLSDNLGFELNFVGNVKLPVQLDQLLCGIDLEISTLNQCYKHLIILVFVERNQCSNDLGCAIQNGILISTIFQEGITTVWLYSTDNINEDASILIHEIGHVFGATHEGTTYIMNPSMSKIITVNFSAANKEQVKQLLEILDVF